MFTSQGLCQFSRKLKFSVGPCVDLTLGYWTTNVKCVHSVQQFKRKKSCQHINRPQKRSAKSVERQKVDPKVYARDIITKISNILRLSTWDSAQDQLKNLSIKWDSYTVNQVLKTHPPMEKAWLFFNWASHLRGFKHDQYTYTTMLDIFGEARRISSMKYVFEQMQGKGIKTDAVTYTSLLHWLSNDGDVNGSLKLWKEMKANGCFPTVVSYTAYMKVLFDHKRVEEATEVFKEMLQSGCPPNCHTYTVLMEHLAHTGKFKEVLEIFSKMQETGVYPDKATCNILVEKCSKAGETWAMMKILQYMRENSLVLRYSVYTEALETLNIGGVSDDLLREVNPHFSSQQIDKEERNLFNITAVDMDSGIDQGLVLNFLGRQNFVAVDCLLADMLNKNARLDSGIVSTIIQANSVNCRSNGALLAFEYSMKMGISIERAAYLALIGVHIRKNSFSKAVNIVEEAFRAGFSLGTHLAALLIFRLGRARYPAYAEKIFDLLPYDQKNTTTYTALMSAYFSSGKANKGLEIFETMRREEIRFALGTYNVLLTGLEQSGRVSELESYRKEKRTMQADGHPPAEEITCNFLFAGYGTG